MINRLPDEILYEYEIRKNDIRNRLQDFKKVHEKDYFYEASYCILTPQTKAKNADLAIKRLIELDFKNNSFNPQEILFDKSNYIRFHNTKAQRLIDLKENFSIIEYFLKTNHTPFEKREFILKNIKGYGLKESSHFLRNIGYENLAILDRHILSNFVKIGLFPEIPKINPNKYYYETEREFLAMADIINIPIDELDLLFWSIENGEILK